MTRARIADVDHAAHDALGAVLDRITIAEQGFSALELFAVRAIEAGYSRRRVAALTGLDRRRLDRLLASSWLALISPRHAPNPGARADTS